MILLLFLISGCCAESQTIQFGMEFEAKMATGSVVQLFKSPNVVACARSCSRHQDCVSMFYVEDMHTCSLQDQIFVESSAGLVANPAAKYYELKASPPISTPMISTPTLLISTTQSAMTSSQLSLTTSAPVPSTTTLTYLTQQAPCPQDDSIFRPAVTSIGTMFQLRIFIDAHRVFTDADHLCQTHGAKLYKVLTPDKLTFTQNLLSCAAYINSDFWINGMYHNTNDYRTTDGEPIPMTSTFWFPDRPNYPGSENCTWFYSGFGPVYDDTFCDNGNVYTICEIE